MFNIFKNFASKKELSYLDNKLSKSFGGVRQDTSTLFEWIKYLDQRISEQQKTLSEINQKVSNIPKKDYGKEVNEALENIHSLNEKLNQTISYCHHLNQKTEYKEKPVEKTIVREIIQEKPKTFKERLIKKITRNSKNYIKTVILNLISKYEGISSAKLREIVVEEQGLCSKSSFYRTLTELENSGDVEVKHQGPERIYISRLLKTVR
ncbi:MAG: hypothetical protein KAQ83_03075 [Nanoarchaeota archaeon]|nr:hypothetical protein [Nanoarchaeota archaeon]